MNLTILLNGQLHSLLSVERHLPEPLGIVFLHNCIRYVLSDISMNACKKGLSINTPVIKVDLELSEYLI